MLNMEIRNNTLTVEGYVNAVERYSKEIRENGKIFFEKIESGAFKRALENNDNVQMYFNHNPKRILAQQKNKTLNLTEDNIGLKVRATIDDNEIIDQAKKGNLTGWSFGFTCIKDNWEDNKRSIRDLHLFEVSLLNVEPAYIGTSVEFRDKDETVIKSIRSGGLSLKESTEEKDEDFIDEEKRQMQLQKLELDIFFSKLQNH